MNRRTGIHLLTLFLLAQCLPLPAAEPQQGEPREQRDDELSQILIEGRQPERNPQKVIAWMARLVGEFDFSGEVDLQARGRPQDLRPVRGHGSCIGFGPAPAVRCELNVRWTPVPVEDHGKVLGGVSHLQPATMLFGFEKDRLGIRHMLVGSNGIAEAALGYILDDTLVSRAPCVGVPGQCERVARITAGNELQKIDMQIDLEIDYQPAVRFHFVMRRVAGSKAVVVGGPKVLAGPAEQ